MTVDKLKAELEKARKEIKTDHYQMSIGELISLYKDNDLKLDPAYQRLFRWEDPQKTKFIESLILGIPIPPIFVAQKEDGVWDIIDGVQRISSILQLTGDLPDKDKLVLTDCQYIPSLKGMTWDDLPDDVVRLIKRARISINIVLTENSLHSQYELFQRLNTGGIHLSDQEVRNCLIIMTDNEFFESIDQVKKEQAFLDSIRQKKRSLQEEFHMELILRYLIAKHSIYNVQDYNVSTDLLSDFIDKETLKLIADATFDIDTELKLMIEAVTCLNDLMDGQAFLKYNKSKNRFEGAFSVSMFEATLSGISKNLDKIKKLSGEEFKDLVIALHEEQAFIDATKPGIKALKRFFDLNKLSVDYFGKV